MKRWTKTAVPMVAAFAGCALVALWAHAIGAPPDQYDLFNKTDKTIIDLQTGLQWQRTPSATTESFAQAQADCAAAADGGAPMRLPTYKELLTLVDEDPHSEYDPINGTTLRYIDPNAFPGTPGDFFWTLSADTAHGGIKVVNFNTGATGYVPVNGSAYRRCVQP